MQSVAPLRKALVRDFERNTLFQTQKFRESNRAPRFALVLREIRGKNTTFGSFGRLIKGSPAGTGSIKPVYNESHFWWSHRVFEISMSRTLKAVVLSVSMALVLFTIVGGLRVRAESNDGAYRQLGVYSEVLSRIRSEYVEEPNIPVVTDGALHGLLESLDANSSYLTPEEYKQFKSRKSEGKGDIGATISKRFGYAAVVSVIPGGPADKAGLESGDIIEAIEGKTTREMSLAEIMTYTMGEPGSNLNIAVVRPRKAEPQKLTITRNTVSIPAVSDKNLEDGIGYIKVDAFTQGKSQEIASKVKAMQTHGIKKLILDVRDCSAGDAKEGIATANLFLNHGLITYLQGQRYPK